MVYSFGQLPASLTDVNVKDGFRSQLSVTVNTGFAGIFVQETFTSAGSELKAGAVKSLTVMV